MRASVLLLRAPGSAHTMGKKEKAGKARLLSGNSLAGRCPVPPGTDAQVRAEGGAGSGCPASGEPPGGGKLSSEKARRCGDWDLEGVRGTLLCSP